jgi:CheY-like chemotaxis protein
MDVTTQKILLVEDNDMDVKLITLTLKRFNLGNDIDTTTDGVEVLDYLYRRGKFSDRAGGDPALMLLDINLPKMNGIEVLRTIRNDPDFKDLPVIVISSTRDVQEIEKCYELGVSDFVDKPIDFLKFLKAIRNIGLTWTLSST